MNKIFFFFCFCVVLFSCNSDDESSQNNSFTGNWAGTYVNNPDSELSSGTWVATVHQDNTITGSYTETDSWQFNASGTIDSNGHVEIGIYELGTNEQAGIFTGSFNPDGTASGNWENTQNANYHGSWIGQKQ